MKYLLTGGSGFLGGILKDSLRQNHDVVTLGRSITNGIIADLSMEEPILPPVDVIIHVAGKAHIVPKTENEKAEFFRVNVTGTKNLLKGIKVLPKSFVFISTVAVYGLDEGRLIKETEELKGDTPYARSKIEAEKLVQDWGIKNQVNVLILRLPLVVGPNAPGNLGAMVKAIKNGFYFRLGDGNARKSMVLAEDVAGLVGDCENMEGVYNLTDGQNPSMAEFDTYLASCFNRKVKGFPQGFLNFAAKIGDTFKSFPLNSYRVEKLQTSLTFSCAKAEKDFGWKPRSVIGNFDPRL
ncbi:NAD-dependent epimerase/dehydratase family protein [Algoriphagus sediminis]|uniref:NAD-dependent epimerase/dehydratase family protein n=1 Tax=Algoriphagus sediminis TaxID=3057113 RepID=A0ABT7YE20_9BACT|nr:NAD-dependent epimerase/dehydratase family protein [Algoriphagus sediminis]MDN3204732.1 NAD-dependent epimerase/dehydratase family protein [Algoriphagus sediminis]